MPSTDTPQAALACPDDASLVALLAGELDAAHTRELHRHLDGCASCRELLANLAPIGVTPARSDAETEADAGTSRARPQDATTLPRGTEIGHFEVHERIGEGGMGTVYAAHDALLGRRVALKLVRSLHPESHDTEHSARLVREARAMAAISHPNVVTVHEVGAFGTQVFLAMELVDGGTLADWLLADPHTWTEILRRFIAAGRGLAAAHAAGLVHRDFKPQNVLLWRSGRVCVSDFGLVRATTSGTDAAPAEAAHDGWSNTLTATGGVMGTPRYMAPEQMLGEPTDARTDQFAFCVALFEALFACHPFGDEPNAWRVRATTGSPRDPPRGPVPGRIVRTIMRGLAHEPQARFESMTALLDTLEATMRWRRNAVIAIAGTGTVAAAIFTGFMVGRPEVHGFCDSPPFDRFGAAWDVDRRAAITRAAADEAALGILRLDDYVDRGERLRAQMCAAIEPASADARVLAQRSLECLAARDEELDVVTELLAAGESIAPVEVPDVIAGLSPIESCRDVSARASVAPPPAPALEPDVRGLRRRISAASATAWAGRPSEAIAALEPVLVEAERLDYPPLVARVHLALGAAARATDRATSDAHLQAAYSIALGTGDDAEVVSALRVLAVALAERGDDPVTARWLTDEAEAWNARLGLLEDPMLGFARAMIARSEGDLVRAIAASAHGAELADGADSGTLERATLHGQLGALLLEKDELDLARVHITLALELTEAMVGPTHRRTLWSRTNLAGIALRSGDFAEAERMLEEVLHAFEATAPTDLPENAVTLSLLAMAERAQGELADALVHDRRALEIRRRVFGDSDALVAESMGKVALDQMSLGDPADAVVTLRQVVEMRQRFHPAGHPAIDFARIELSRALGAAGQRTEAASEATAALDRLTESLAADDQRLYGPWLYAGIAALEVDDFDRAASRFERARVLLHAGKLDPLDAAELEFMTARAQARGDHSMASARTLATKARARLEPVDAAHTTLMAEIDRWLAGN